MWKDVLFGILWLVSIYEWVLLFHLVGTHSSSELQQMKEKITKLERYIDKEAIKLSGTLSIDTTHCWSLLKSIEEKVSDIKKLLGE